MLTAKDFRVGERVQLHPAPDAWMRGLRYGSVHSVGRRFVTVLTDVGKYRLKVLPEYLNHSE